MINPLILRAYDIRGTYGVTLNDGDAYYLGAVLATLLFQNRLLASQNPIDPPPSPKVVVGYDGRFSSPELSQILIDSLVLHGCDVIDIGMVPTPVNYYAQHYFGAEGAVMVTGSHNPPQDNGFKIMMGGESFFGEDLQRLNDPVVHEYNGGRGRIQRDHDFFKHYVQFLRQSCSLTLGQAKAIKIIIDTGHGVVGAIIDDVLQALNLDLNTTILYKKVDGAFPAHSPDPSDEVAMTALKKMVVENEADFGIAFDGDGDRFGLVDGKGRLWCGDQLSAFFINHLCIPVHDDHRGAQFLLDIKASQALLTYLDPFCQSLEAKVRLVPSGHSIIKKAMKEYGAIFAGEVSGHFFFADTFQLNSKPIKALGFDDGLYSFVRLLNILGSCLDPKGYLCQWYDQLPLAYTTPEWRLPCEEGDKELILNQIRQMLLERGCDYISIDGIRFSDERGYWIVRASNTQSLLTVRLEGASKPHLLSLHNELQQILEGWIILPLCASVFDQSI